MGIIVLNPEGFKELSKYSGNPFLDAMVDFQDVFNTIMAYQKHKPYIDKYSDTSLSDLKDKIKTNLPEALNEDGSINFSILEELANQGNEMAKTILGIKEAREHFANASIGGKLATFLDKKLQPQLDILSGNILSKQAKVLKTLSEFEEKIKNSNLPDVVKTIMLENKEVFAKNPQVLSIILPFFMSNQNQQSDSDHIKSQSPQIKDMETTAKENMQVPNLNYNNPNAVAQDILSAPQSRKFVEKLKKKSKVGKKLEPKHQETDIINYLKSLPQNPPVMFYRPSYPNNLQGSPIYHYDIKSLILNPRPFLNKE